MEARRVYFKTVYNDFWLLRQCKHNPQFLWHWKHLLSLNVTNYKFWMFTFLSFNGKWNVRNKTRLDIRESASLRYSVLCIVTRLISDVLCSHNMKMNIQFLKKFSQYESWVIRCFKSLYVYLSFFFFTQILRIVHCIPSKIKLVILAVSFA